MASVEKIGDDYYPFDEKGIIKVPQAAGTFVLADQARQIIYIGFGTNLNKMLMNVKKSGSNYCLSRATFFGIVINPDPLKGAAHLFVNYKEGHSGIIPRCNKYDLSVNIK